jgi:hypothetical protein
MRKLIFTCIAAALATAPMASIVKPVARFERARNLAPSRLIVSRFHTGNGEKYGRA